MRPAHQAIAAYYASKGVRERIAEYCQSALAISGYGGHRALHDETGAPEAISSDIGSLLVEGADVCRSLADSQGTLLHLDVDSYNPSDPTESLEQPERTFGRLEPVYEAVLAAFARYRIEPLALMTGRGYHFVARARWGTPLFESLLGIGHLGPPLRGKYDALAHTIPNAARMGVAHDGAGRLLEHLAHEVLRDAVPSVRRLLALSDVERPDHGPTICLDLSEYADPLFERCVRAAFSSHQKAHLRGLNVRQPVTAVLPRNRRPLDDVLLERADLLRAARAADDATATIPEAPDEARAWADDYRESALGRFHAELDRDRHEDPSDWPVTYDRVAFDRLPGCVASALRSPNPALLEPAHLRVVTLALVALGWPPRAVAGLVRSKYERDFGWGALWYRYDAAARADFYVRLFCGALADGTEDVDALTCATEQARGLCVQRGCGYELDRLVADLSAVPRRVS